MRADGAAVGLCRRRRATGCRGHPRCPIACHLAHCLRCSLAHGPDFLSPILLLLLLDSEHIEDLLNEYEVDIVFSGHMHSYSRSCNVQDGRCVDPGRGGMTHVTIGTGGKKLSQVGVLVVSMWRAGKL